MLATADNKEMQAKSHELKNNQEKLAAHSNQQMTNNLSMTAMTDIQPDAKIDKKNHSSLSSFSDLPADSVDDD